MSHKPYLHIKEAQPPQSVIYTVRGLLSEEPIPSIGDHLILPDDEGVYRVTNRMFMYGVTQDEGNVREIILYVQQVRL